MTENIENKVGNYYDGFKKVVGALALGSLCSVAGYTLARYNIPSNRSERVQTEIYSEVSKNDLEKKTEKLDSIKKDDRKKERSYEIVVESSRGDKKSVDDLVNSKEVIDENELKRVLEEVMQKYKDVFVYVPDEDYKYGELRIKVEGLSEKEKSWYLSINGIKYDKKNGYISFSDEFKHKDREFYESMKDIAFLSKSSNRNEISNKEKRFIEENAPEVYRTLFIFEEEIGNELEKKVKILEKKLTKKYSEVDTFSEKLAYALVKGFVHVMEEKHKAEVEKAVKGMNTFPILGGGGYGKSDGKEDKKLDNVKKLGDIDEAPIAPGKDEYGLYSNRNNYSDRKKDKKLKNRKLEDDDVPPAPLP